MPTDKAILEQWLARALESYSAETAHFLATEKDPFRNPVGQTLRANLAVLLEEVLGDGSAAAPVMDSARVRSALENIARIRAVQDATASEAVGFVFLLRPIVRQRIPEHDPALLHERIDRLALMAVEEYVRCRELLAELRVQESQRALHVPSAMARRSTPAHAKPACALDPDRS